jgi:FkbM family methyltransferase
MKPRRSGVTTTLRTRAFAAVATHRRSGAAGFVARLCNSYLRAYDNVNHNLRTNGETELVSRLPPVRMALDVGMHTGTWTDALLAAHPAAAVHGFEPSPDLGAALHRRYAGTPAVVVNTCGLGRVATTMDLHVDPTHSSLSSVVVDPRRAASTTVPIQLIRGDDYLATHGIDHVDVLKVDVEGFDLDVLHGFAGALASGAIDVVQFEYNGWTLIARHFLAEFYDLLEAHDYVLGKLHPAGVDFAPYQLEAENWRGPACVAVRRARPDLVAAAAGRS